MLINYKFLYKITKLKLFMYFKSNNISIKNNCLYDLSLNYLCTSKISQKKNWLIYSPLTGCPNSLKKKKKKTVARTGCPFFSFFFFNFF